MSTMTDDVPTPTDAELREWLQTVPLPPLREFAGHRSTDTSTGIGRDGYIETIMTSSRSGKYSSIHLYPYDFALYSWRVEQRPKPEGRFP